MFCTSGTGNKSEYSAEKKRFTTPLLAVLDNGVQNCCRWWWLGLFVEQLIKMCRGLHGTTVECQSLASVFSLSCALPVADG